MKYANIVPNALNKIADKHNDLHLLLVHWAMENKEYTNFYRKSKVYKILDNSFYELRKILPAKELLHWAYILKVDEVVLPDKMYDYKTTKKLINEFFNNLDFNTFLNFKWQAVVCGRTEKEIKKCFIDYLNDNRINIISFSRRGQVFSNECHDNARFRIVKWACEYMIKHNKIKPIHLLGANGIKDYYREWPKQVRSLDSKQYTNTLLGDWKLNCKVSSIQKQIFKYLIKKEE